LKGEPSPQSMCALEQVFIKDHFLLCSVSFPRS
jgi:hypothetical protein